MIIAAALRRVEYVTKFLGWCEFDAKMDVYGHPMTAHAGALCMVFEWSKHGSLHGRLAKEAQLSPAVALRWILQIAFGIQALTRYLVCHSDLKPE